jgi:hypothetical protein
MKVGVIGNKKCLCKVAFEIENLNGYIIVLQNSPLSVIEKNHLMFPI